MIEQGEDPKEWARSDWRRLFESITNPEKRDEARRKVERKARIEQKRKDTGL